MARQYVVRDIREDLFERMEAATAEMAEARTRYDVERRELEQRFQKLFEDIGNRQRALSILLDEEHKARGPSARVMPQQKELRLPLADFILNGLDAAGPMSKDDVKDMVERAGYGGSEGVGRMVHTTLLNLKNSGKLHQTENGAYRVVRSLLKLPQFDEFLQKLEGVEDSFAERLKELGRNGKGLLADG